MRQYIKIMLIGFILLGCAPKVSVDNNTSYQRQNNAYDKAMDELNK